MVEELRNRVGSKYDYHLLVFIRLDSLNTGALGLGIKLGDRVPEYSRPRKSTL